MSEYLIVNGNKESEIIRNLCFTDLIWDWKLFVQ